MKKNLFLFSGILVAGLLAACASTGGGDPIVSTSEEAESNVVSTPKDPTSMDETSVSEVVDDPNVTVLSTLHVILYQKQITDTTKVDEFKVAFGEYLASKKVRIPTITWDYVGTGAVATLSSELEAFEKENYRGDVVLGAKAVSASNAPWFNENYEVYMNGEENVEIEFGGNTARRLWVNKNLANPTEASYLISYYRTLAGLPETEDPKEDIPEDSSIDSEETSIDVSEPPVESSVDNSEPAEETSESSEETSDPREETSSVYVTVGWWGYSTSGMTQTIADNLETGLKSYLTEQGVGETLVNSIVFRCYEESAVADMGAAINADGDVDIYIGAGANLTTKGGVTVVERKSNVQIGEKTSRYIDRLTDTAGAIASFAWLTSDAGLAVLNPAE